MTITAILTALISLLLIYYTLSLIINALMSIIKDLLDLRANALEQILVDLFQQNMCYDENQGTLYDRFIHHELIANLKPIRYWFISQKPRDTKIPRINFETFSLTLLDTLDSKELIVQNIINPLLEKADSQTQGLLHSLRQPFATDEEFLQKAQEVLAQIPDHHTKIKLNRLITFFQLPPENQLHRVQLVIETLPPGKTKETLQALLNVGYNDVDSAHQRLQIWYNNSMARASALFTQQANAYVIIIACLVTLFIGTDTILIVRTLWDQPVRNQIVTEQLMPLVETVENELITEKTLNMSTDELVVEISTQIDNILYIFDQLQSINDIPITWPTLHPLPFLIRANWPQKWTGWDGIFAKILGLILTAIAISRGSSFWYDILKRLNPNIYPQHK